MAESGDALRHAILLCFGRRVRALRGQGVIYLHAIKKYGGYVHVMKSFVDTCVPCTQLLFTHVPFRLYLELTVSNRQVK
jgi:hypothetical protein